MKRNKKMVKDSNFRDYTQNLSDDLLSLIFTKLVGFDQHPTIADIEFLCQCSLVSKRFNSIIPRLPSLSITSASSTKFHLTFPKIIEKFKHIVSLYVEHGDVLNSRKYFDWKATLQPSATYCIAGISYDSIKKYSTIKNKHLLSNHPIAEYPENRVITLAHVLETCALQAIILEQIQNLKLLEHVVITDVKRRGSLILDKEKLVQLRNSSFDGIYPGGKICLFYTKSLHLQKSDLLLKEVSFVIIFKPGKYGADCLHKDDYSILRAMNFQDDEMIFREALVSILEKADNNESSISYLISEL